MSDAPKPTTGVILGAQNGDVIGFDATGLVMRLSDKVIADIAARLDFGQQVQSPAPESDATPDLPDDIDAWAIRGDGDWLHFQANLPGAAGPRGYRRHIEGGAILAEARGPLLAILGIGGARAGLGWPGPGAFAHHIFAPADDIGAVGMGGEGEAPLTHLLQQLPELTQEALLAECLLARRAAARKALPLIMVRAETDQAGAAAELAKGLAIANLERAAANLVAAANRLGTGAQLLAVTLDYALEDVSGDPTAYRDGILAVMERITRSLGKLGLPRPVFLCGFDCGTHAITDGPALEGQWELSWNHGDHQLVFACPGYAFAMDDTGRLTEAGARAKAAISAEALLVAQNGERWLCPTIQLAERAGDDIHLICEAGDFLAIDPADPFGAGPAAGFRLEGVTNGAVIIRAEIDKGNRKTVILRCSTRPEGDAVRVSYAFGAAPGSGPYPANAGALRDLWAGQGPDGPLHRWALPARLTLTGGGR